MVTRKNNYMMVLAYRHMENYIPKKLIPLHSHSAPLQFCCMKLSKLLIILYGYFLMWHLTTLSGESASKVVYIFG